MKAYLNHSFRCVGITLLYALCAVASVRIFWLPCGFALAMFLLVERRQWLRLVPCIVAGEALYNWTGSGSNWPSWGEWALSFLNAGCALLGAFLIQRILSGRPRFDSIQKVSILLCVGGVVAIIPCATFGTYLVQLAGSKRTYLAIWTSWCMRDFLGILLMAPFILSWVQSVGLQDRMWDGARRREAMLLLAGLLLTLGCTMFFTETSAELARFAVIPFVLWSGIRFGVRGITAISLITALILGWMSTKGIGMGHLGTISVAARNLNLQISVASLAFFGLIPAIVVQAQRLAEELLREERNFSQATLENEPIGVIVTNPAGELIQINRSGLQLFEVSDHAEIRALGVTQFIAPDRVKEYTSVSERVAAGAKESLELIVYGRHGGVRLAEIKSVPLFNANGSFRAMLSLWRDVTEERKTQEALKLAHFTVDRAAMPILWIKPDGRIFDTNTATANMLGYSVDWLKSQRIDSIESGSRGNSGGMTWQDAKANKETLFVTEMKQRSGATLSVEVRAHFMKIGQEDMLCAFLLDVTARKKAEAILRHSEERLAMIFANAPDGIIVCDGNGLFQEANPSAAQMFGLSSRMDHQRTIADPGWKMIFENKLPTTPEDDPMMICLRTQQPVRGMVRGLILANGSIRWLAISAQPLTDAEGKLTRIVSSYSDITEQRSLQEQVRHSQKMEVVGQLAGGIAHDFNNILTALSLNLERIDRSTEFPSSLRHLTTDLKAMCQRAAGLTEQLLLFARRRPIQMKTLDLNASIVPLIKILRATLSESVNIVPKLEKTKVLIEGDSGMIDQIVMNLCINARDAMPRGGAVMIETGVELVDQKFVNESTFQDARLGKFAFLRISDEGTGMSPETLSHIFEPFFTTKEVGRGTGLGLASVHSIALQHNAWIAVQSALGQGTTFTVYFPKSDAHEATATKQQPTIKTGLETILLVEDEHAVRLGAAMILRDIGYQIIEASDGREAIELWEKYSSEVDLVLTDMVMPGGYSGLEMLAKLRISRPELKAILMTGYSESIVRSEHVQVKDLRVLQKPFDFDKLVKTISDALGST